MKDQRMETKKIGPLLLEFSLPAVIGMSVNAIYNIVDRMFIGNAPGLGGLGLAGITITFPITLILIALSLASGVGGATRFSINLGQKNIEEARKYLGNSLCLSIFFGLFFTVFGNLFLDQILYFLGSSQQVLPYAREYLSIILFGAVFQCVAMWGNNLSRAQGNPKNAMISQIIGAGFNILFDYIFIFKLNLGMAGAAYATIGGQFLSAMWQLSFMMSKRSLVQVKLTTIRFQFRYIKSIIKTGLPAFGMQIANAAVSTALNSTTAKYGGDVAISTVGVVTSFQTVLLMPLMGISQGQQTLVSYNFGAKLQQRVKETIKYSIVGATIVATIGFLGVRLFPAQIMMLFTKEVEIIELGTKVLPIWFLAIFVVGAQIQMANYFQAVGKIKEASVLSLLRQIGLLIPFLYILSSQFGLYGIFYAVPVADFLSFIITFYFLHKESYLFEKNSG